MLAELQDSRKRLMDGEKEGGGDALQGANDDSDELGMLVARVDSKPQYPSTILV